MPLGTQSDPIAVVIADDHLVVRAGLRAILGAESGIHVVGEAANGLDALELIHRLTPDVAVLDLDMPVMDGLATLQALVKARSPARVLILSIHEEDDNLARLLNAGAAGYLPKTVADREFARAIRTVASGETYVTSMAARALAKRVTRLAARGHDRIQYESLSGREREVLVGVAEGRSAVDIGRRLLISPKSVETYKQRVADKLGLRHRADYVRFCLGLDLLHG